MQVFLLRQRNISCIWQKWISTLSWIDCLFNQLQLSRKSQHTPTPWQSMTMGPVSSIYMHVPENQKPRKNALMIIKYYKMDIVSFSYQHNDSDPLQPSFHNFLTASSKRHSPLCSRTPWCRGSTGHRPQVAGAPVAVAATRSKIVNGALSFPTSQETQSPHIHIGLPAHLVST